MTGHWNRSARPVESKDPPRNCCLSRILPKHTNRKKERNEARWGASGCCTVLTRQRFGCSRWRVPTIYPCPFSWWVGIDTSARPSRAAASIVSIPALVWRSLLATFPAASYLFSSHHISSFKLKEDWICCCSDGPFTPAGSCWWSYLSAAVST